MPPSVSTTSCRLKRQKTTQDFQKERRMRGTTVPGVAGGGRLAPRAQPAAAARSEWS